jgi:hypothetical protein
VGEGPLFVSFFDQVITDEGTRASVCKLTRTAAISRQHAATWLTLVRRGTRVIMLPPSTGDRHIKCGWFEGEPSPV